MKTFNIRFVVLACILTSFRFAHASEIYKLNDVGRFQSFSAQINATEIEDAIPQIGIVILKNKTTKNGWVHLGQPGLIHITTPAPTAPKRLWGLKAINVEQAWTKTLGEGIIVAVSDTGVDSDHPDLAENMWHNPKEIPNGIDDDKNGFIDDIYGWDFVKKKPSGTDHHFHGTHVAGTIAARISKKMAGVAPKAQIMDVSFLDSSGSGDEVAAAKTIIYAADNGAKIVNCSWGTTGQIPVVAEAIKYALSKGTLVIAAAGNDSMNTDRHADSPSGEDVENIISVGSTSSASGGMSSFSNYGAKTVDLAAPGSEIFSTAPSGKSARYQTLSGTSMATPHVSGAAALVWSRDPKMSWLEVKERLMKTSIPNRNWTGKSVSGGVMNVGRAVEP